MPSSSGERAAVSGGPNRGIGITHDGLGIQLAARIESVSHVLDGCVGRPCARAHSSSSVRDGNDDVIVHAKDRDAIVAARCAAARHVMHGEKAHAT
jgi:hypothetical protein